MAQLTTRSIGPRQQEARKRTGNGLLVPVKSRARLLEDSHEETTFVTEQRKLWEDCVSQADLNKDASIVCLWSSPQMVNFSTEGKICRVFSTSG
ncbi:hypothetical protein BCY86_08870 [Pajaroellobacter abortibovis]|uniref:Uncharacterized protein n=1 Tax=Pajaroellobacter abortibovis TaxID=1882918 RepID=A0A1L6MZ44_9BACT|nr:hypothetical protein BCY86_08870 [Pajaroellobacter abortibovis]